MVQLREYQQNIIEETFSAWESLQAVMLQMPTGTGKTTVFSEIVKRQISQIAPNKRVLILVHRKELVEQIFDRLRSFCIRAGKKVVVNYFKELNVKFDIAVLD